MYLLNNIGCVNCYITVIFTVIITYIVYNLKNIYIIVKTFPRDIRFLKHFITILLNYKYWLKHNETVSSLFEQNVAKSPGKTCFMFEDQTWTFKDLNEYANRVAQVFWNAGYRHGDVVCLFMTNRVEFIGIWLGLSKIGVVSAFINTNIRNISLEHCIKVADAKSVIFSEDLANAVGEIRGSFNELDFYYYGSTDGQIDTCKNLQTLVQEARSDLKNIYFRPKTTDPLLYIYTSGTTGMPKPAVIPNSRFMTFTSAAFNFAEFRKWTNNSEGDIIYNCLPLYHLAGGGIGVGMALIYGLPVVLRKKFSATNYWKDCIKYKCTVAQYIGEIGRYLTLQPPRPEDTQHSVRAVIGNGVRPEVWKEMLRRFKIGKVIEIYGATEGNAAMVNVEGKIGSIGYLPSFIPEKYFPISLIKVDSMNEPMRGPDGFCIRCKPNEPGMLIGQIGKPKTVREFHGYLNKEQNDNKILHNTFKKGDQAFISGDIMVKDDYGYFYFKDRTGDTYKWKGENVSTTEIEDVVSKVIGKRACVVYGVNVPATEGKVGMIAISEDMSESLDMEQLGKHLDHCLPSYSRPIFLRMLKEIEITGTFKLRKITYMKEGFDPSIVKDIYIRKSGEPWKPLTLDIYTDICEGRVNL